MGSGSFKSVLNSYALIQHLYFYNNFLIALLKRAFSLYHGLIKLGNKLWAVENAAMQARLIQAFHFA